MQVQKISFTSSTTQEQPKKESALYSKDGYMNLLRTNQFTNGFLATFGLLEAIDKFQLIKNNKNLSAKALNQKAWKHTKYNLLGGITAGILSTLIGKFVTDKYTIPFSEKMWDFKVKQEEISKRTSELMKQVNEEYKQKSKDAVDQTKNDVEKKEIKTTDAQNNKKSEKEETTETKTKTDKNTETENKKKAEEK